ncbi:hypothetical protein [Staphylococcus xylosus]|uniref:hypothetical protein n=1 Tax=Staphylococcus xylosus TaxID=1288 RepID=UPI0011C7DF3A|nr:hypothetical protein [Staphylococcus xylosus]WRY40200.1 hypothetical protein P8F82_00195 [Staphylococcus xylosus]
MFGMDYSSQISFKPLSFELYLNFLDEMMDSKQMEWFLKDVDSLNLYGVLEIEDIDLIQSSIEDLKDFYYSTVEKKVHEFNEYTDIKEEHEEISALLFDIDRHIKDMMHQINHSDELEECLIVNFENTLDLFEDKKSEVKNLKNTMDLHFKLVGDWDEKIYIEFISFFMNKSDFKYMSILIGELGESLKNEQFNQKELKLLSFIQGVVRELIMFYEQFFISSAYELGEWWFEIDYDIRMSLISINKDITLVEYMYIKNGVNESVIELLEKIFSDFSNIIDAILLLNSYSNQ